MGNKGSSEKQKKGQKYKEALEKIQDGSLILCKQYTNACATMQKLNIDLNMDDQDEIITYINIFCDVFDYASKTQGKIHRKANSLGEGDLASQEYQMMMDSEYQKLYEKEITQKKIQPDGLKQQIAGQSGKKQTSESATDLNPEAIQQIHAYKKNEQNLNQGINEEIQQERSSYGYNIQQISLIRQNQISKLIDKKPADFIDRESEKKPEYEQVTKIFGLCKKTILKQKPQICQCCGLMQQKQKLSICTDVQHVNHLGISNTLFFRTIKYLAVMLGSIFLVFCAFSIVTNYIISHKHEFDKQLSILQFYIYSIGPKMALYGKNDDFVMTTLIIQSLLVLIGIAMLTLVLGCFLQVQKKYIEKADFLSVQASDYTLKFSNIPKIIVLFGLIHNIRKQCLKFYDEINIKQKKDPNKKSKQIQYDIKHLKKIFFKKCFFFNTLKNKLIPLPASIEHFNFNKNLAVGGNRQTRPFQESILNKNRLTVPKITQSKQKQIQQHNDSREELFNMDELTIPQIPQTQQIFQYYIQAQLTKKNIKETVSTQSNFNRKIQVSKVNFVYYLYDQVQDCQQNKEIQQLEKNIKKIQEQIEAYKNWFITAIQRKRNKSNQFTTKQVKAKLNKFYNLKKLKSQLTNQLEEEKRLQRLLKIANKRQYGGVAFVTFKHTFNKGFLLEHFAQKKIYFPDFQSKITQEIPIKVELASQPEDIIWETFNKTSRQKKTRELLSLVIVFLLLLIYAYIMTILQTRKLKLEAQGQNFQLFVMRNTTSLFIVMAGILLSIFLQKLSEWQHKETKTQQQCLIAVSSLIGLIFTSIVIPLITNIYVKPHLLYELEGLPKDIFSQVYMSILLSIVSVIVNLCRKDYWLNRLKFFYLSLGKNKYKVTQPQLNQLYEKSQFDLGQKYAQAISIYLFACFYSTLQPLVVPLCIVQLVILYYSQKIYLFRCSKRPIPGNEHLHKVMFKYILSGTMFFAAGSLLFTCVLVSQVKIIILVLNLIAVVLSIFITFMPAARSYYRSYYKRSIVRPGVYRNDRIFMPIEYDRLNPQFSELAQLDYNSYLRKFIIEKFLLMSHQQKQSMRNRMIIGRYNAIKSRQDAWEEGINLADSEQHYRVLLDYNHLVQQCNELIVFWQSLSKLNMSDVPVYLQIGDYNSERLIVIPSNTTVPTAQTIYKKISVKRVNKNDGSSEDSSRNRPKENINNLKKASLDRSLSIDSSNQSILLNQPLRNGLRKNQNIV